MFLRRNHKMLAGRRPVIRKTIGLLAFIANKLEFINKGILLKIHQMLVKSLLAQISHNHIELWNRLEGPGGLLSFVLCSLFPHIFTHCTGKLKQNPKNLLSCNTETIQGNS